MEQQQDHGPQEPETSDDEDDDERTRLLRQRLAWTGRQLLSRSTASGRGLARAAAPRSHGPHAPEASVDEEDGYVFEGHFEAPCLLKDPSDPTDGPSGSELRIRRIRRAARRIPT